LTPFGGAEQLAWSPDGLKIAYTCKKKQVLFKIHTIRY